MRKVLDNVKTLISLEAGTYTTDTAGQQYVDTKGYRDGALVVAAGAIIGTGTDTYTVTLFEGDATASMTTTGITVTFTGTGSQAKTVRSARIADLNVTRKRYLQAKLTCSATTISFAGCAVIELGLGASNPVN